VSGAVVLVLPEDGTWAKYHFHQHNDRDGAITNEQTGVLIVKSVGREQAKGVDCRWIEFEFQSESDETGQANWIAKDLIPEEEIGFGKQTVDHFVRGWEKNGDAPAKGRSEFPSFADHLGYPSAWNPLQTKEKESRFNYQKGELQLAAPTEGTTSFKDRRLNILTHNIIWRSAESPFGMVRLKQQMQFRSADDEIFFRTVVRDLELIDFGSGAKSALPNSN
jgi:hypothetical protein